MEVNKLPSPFDVTKVSRKGNGRLECDEEYIGKTSRTFGERYKEHLKAPSPIHDHSNTTGHTTLLENFSIVGREQTKPDDDEVGRSRTSPG